MSKILSHHDPTFFWKVLYFDKFNISKSKKKSLSTKMKHQQHKMCDVCVGPTPKFPKSFWPAQKINFD